MIVGDWVSSERYMYSHILVCDRMYQTWDRSHRKSLVRRAPRIFVENNQTRVGEKEERREAESQGEIYVLVIILFRIRSPHHVVQTMLFKLVNRTQNKRRCRPKVLPAAMAPKGKAPHTAAKANAKSRRELGEGSLAETLFEGAEAAEDGADEAEGESDELEVVDEAAAAADGSEEAQDFRTRFPNLMS
jgi:hypothetical protein